MIEQLGLPRIARGLQGWRMGEGRAGHFNWTSPAASLD